jgi:hypothetical protein
VIVRRLEDCRARAGVLLSNIQSLIGAFAAVAAFAHRSHAPIGYFDLHPHRALDIVLDVFSDNVIAHHVFFRELIAMSPWAERQRLGEDVDPNVGPAGERGSRQIASILGFKFAYYSSPEAPADIPYRLYYMAAILIRDGIISLPDLYPYVRPVLLLRLSRCQWPTRSSL